MINVQTKFEVFSLSRSSESIKLSCFDRTYDEQTSHSIERIRDSDHTPFRDGLSSERWDLL